MSEIASRRYRPNPDVVCERCVFGTGEHSDWCGVGKERIFFGGSRLIIDERIPKGMIVLMPSADEEPWKSAIAGSRQSMDELDRIESGIR